MAWLGLLLNPALRGPSLKNKRPKPFPVMQFHAPTSSATLGAFSFQNEHVLRKDKTKSSFLFSSSTALKRPSPPSDNCASFVNCCHQT